MLISSLNVSAAGHSSPATQSGGWRGQATTTEKSARSLLRLIIRVCVGYQKIASHNNQLVSWLFMSSACCCLTRSIEDEDAASHLIRGSTESNPKAMKDSVLSKKSQKAGQALAKRGSSLPSLSDYLIICLCVCLVSSFASAAAWAIVFEMQHLLLFAAPPSNFNITFIHARTHSQFLFHTHRHTHIHTVSPLPSFPSFTAPNKPSPPPFSQCPKPANLPWWTPRRGKTSTNTWHRPSTTA